MKILETLAELPPLVGQEIAVSDWITVHQDQVNQFAHATHDHQWIHTDPQRAAAESQFKSTIAHGYLTLSLVPHFWYEVAEVNNVKMLVNYGIENLRFNQPVLVNQAVRMRVKLRALTDLRGIAKAEMDVVLEIFENPKPAFTATIVFLYHFK